MFSKASSGIRDSSEVIEIPLYCFKNKMVTLFQLDIISAALPQKAAITELCRVLCCLKNLPSCPFSSSSLYVLHAPEQEIQSTIVSTMVELQMKASVTSNTPNVSLCEASHELMSFLVFSSLFQAGWSLIRGYLVHSFSSDRPLHPALRVSIQVMMTQEKKDDPEVLHVSLHLYEQVFLKLSLDGPSSSSTHTRYALPSMTAARVDRVSTLSSHKDNTHVSCGDLFRDVSSLQRYWKCMHGIDVGHCDQVAHVVLGGGGGKGRTFTYPQNALLQHPYVVMMATTKTNATDKRALSHADLLKKAVTRLRHDVAQKEH